MTTFGEIVEPSSRNVWEDWDENNHPENIIQLHWAKEFREPNNIRKLIIFEGKYLSDLVEQNKNLELINSVMEIDMHLYRLKSTNDYVCTLKVYNLVLSSDIVELLKTYITASDEVLTILTKPLVEYHSSGDHLQSCIIRKLSTKAVSEPKTSKYLKLEQPNIISGASAGAICLRDVLNLPASAIIFYTEQLENYELNELCDLLQNLNIIIVKKKPGSILNSNLYI